jgi:pyruvate/2-oxoglutarate dehydrogenase complex dihydrolipoamide acyltransferase (E2) component
VRHQVKIPRLGDTTVNVVVLEWLVQVGDDVEVGQPLATVETDKTTTEVPTPIAGRIEALHADVDDEVPIGSTLVSIVADS